MRKDARALVVIDGAGLVLAALGLALLRDPRLVATARDAIPELPWPVLIPATVGLLAAVAHRRRRSRAAVGAALVVAEERRAWQRAVLESGLASERLSRPGMGRRLGPVLVGALVGIGVGAPALGVVAGLLLSQISAPPDEPR